jgi:hypothetical protein
VQFGGGQDLATLPHLTPGLVCLAVVVWGVLCVGMCACRYMCVCVRIWCRHCMRIQPAFGLITIHTYTHTHLNTTRCRNQEDLDLNLHCRENFKSHTQLYVMLILIQNIRCNLVHALRFRGEFGLMFRHVICGFKAIS